MRFHWIFFAALPGTFLRAADALPEKSCAELVAQLDSDLYAERQSAWEKLRALKTAALPALELAAKHPPNANAQMMVRELQKRIKHDAVGGAVVDGLQLAVIMEKKECVLRSGNTISFELEIRNISAEDFPKDAKCGIEWQGDDTGDSKHAHVAEGEDCGTLHLVCMRGGDPYPGEWDKSFVLGMADISFLKKGQTTTLNFTVNVEPAEQLQQLQQEMLADEHQVPYALSEAGQYSFSFVWRREGKENGEKLAKIESNAPILTVKDE